MGRALKLGLVCRASRVASTGSEGPKYSVCCARGQSDALKRVPEGDELRDVLGGELLH